MGAVAFVGKSSSDLLGDLLGALERLDDHSRREGANA